MDDFKLIKFPSSNDERIQRNIERLKSDLWEEENGHFIIELLHICKDYIAELEESAETDIALVNVNTSIICLSQYMIE
jgi:hypothetical protein